MSVIFSFHLSLSGSNIADLCSRNASATALLDRPDLVRAWSVAALVADSKLPVPSDPNSGTPWSQHPFSRQLIHSLWVWAKLFESRPEYAYLMFSRFEHYRAVHDVQTLAMLSCIFQLHCQQFSQNRVGLSSVLSPGNHSPLGSGLGAHLSSSWQDIGSGFTQVASGASSTAAAGVNNIEDDERVQEERTHQQNCLLLDSLLIRQGDEYRRCYANILYQWQLLEQRAEVIKLQSTPSEDHTQIG